MLDDEGVGREVEDDVAEEDVQEVEHANIEKTVGAVVVAEVTEEEFLRAVRAEVHVVEVAEVDEVAVDTKVPKCAEDHDIVMDAPVVSTDIEVEGSEECLPVLPKTRIAGLTGAGTGSITSGCKCIEVAEVVVLVRGEVVEVEAVRVVETGEIWN